MRLEYKKNDNIATLSWCAKVKKDCIEVIHGNNVEITSDWFVEGAWNGNYDDGEFCTSDWFCGTGARVYDDKIIFSTSTDMTSGLFIRRTEGEYCVSNSLYLLMAIYNLHLDIQYAYYEVDFFTNTYGINNYKKTLHVLDDNNDDANVEVCYFSQIKMYNKQCEIIPKQDVDDFLDFSDYYSKLCSAMQNMYNNSKSISRKYRYGIVTTISSGYDAACCAAVAKTIGCDTAVTFSAKGKYKEDSGLEVAKYLGYKNIYECDADSYKHRSDYVEAEYICSGELGASISFSAFDEYYAGNMVLSGERGDSIWDKNCMLPNREFFFEDWYPLLGHAERHLWLGYIHVPMPFFHGTAWPSIKKISNSKEMEPFSLNNDYDRPIPRRICEEAGVPREMFGMKKNGAGFIYRFDWLNRIKGRMSETSATDFENYVKKHRRYRAGEIVSYFLKMKNIYLLRIGLKVTPPALGEQGRTANPLAVRYLLPWAAEIVLNRYCESLRGE